MHMEGVSHCPQGSYSVYLYTFFQAAVACLQNIESDKLKKIWRLSVQAKEKGYLLDKKNLKWQEFKCENREKKTCKMLGHPTVTGLGPAVADTNSALWGGPELLALLLRSEAPGPLPAGWTPEDSGSWGQRSPAVDLPRRTQNGSKWPAQGWDHLWLTHKPLLKKARKCVIGFGTILYHGSYFFLLVLVFNGVNVRWSSFAISQNRSVMVFQDEWGSEWIWKVNFLRKPPFVSGCWMNKATLEFGEWVPAHSQAHTGLMIAALSAWDTWKDPRAL